MTRPKLESESHDMMNWFYTRVIIEYRNFMLSIKKMFDTFGGRLWCYYKQFSIHFIGSLCPTMISFCYRDTKLQPIYLTAYAQLNTQYQSMGPLPLHSLWVPIGPLCSPLWACYGALLHDWAIMILLICVWPSGPSKSPYDPHWPLLPPYNSIGIMFAIFLRLYKE